LPRERPEFGTQDRSPTPSIDLAPTRCQLRLAELAAFKPKPPIVGPGECSATDVVELNAVHLPKKGRVVFSPAATLRCPMAEAVAHGIRDDVEPAIAAVGAPLHDVEVLGSFECRSFNGIGGAHLSEHGHANALDIRSFKPANGAVIERGSLTTPAKSSGSQIAPTLFGPCPLCAPRCSVPLNGPFYGVATSQWVSVGSLRARSRMRDRGCPRHPGDCGVLMSSSPACTIFTPCSFQSMFNPSLWDTNGCFARIVGASVCLFIQLRTLGTYSRARSRGL
jgi:extensin-like protein